MTEAVRVSLASWLLEQVSADEQVARATATTGPWDTRDMSNRGYGTDVAYVVERSDVPDRGFFKLTEPILTGQAAHIARWDPARVLAECAAKRAIVKLHHSRAVDEDGSPEPWASPDSERWCYECGFNGMEEPAQELPCSTLRLLAAPYASEPGYRAEWAVSPSP